MKIRLAVFAAFLVSACAGQPGVPSSMWSWNRAVAPYRVIGDIYYVGSNKIAQFVIKTPEGLILLDSDFEASVPRLRDNVAALGLRFEDVKLLLTSHAHIDHVQGHALVRKLTGAQVVASARDAAFIAAGGKGESVYDGVFSWTPCPVDRVVADGETVTLGGVTLTAHLTPGHTMGAVTWTMQVPSETAGGRPLDVVFFPSANINDGVKLVGNARYPAIADDFAHSFETWKALPCDVFLGVHGGFYDEEAKRARQLAGATPNPFIDPDGYKKFIAEVEAHYREVLAAERR
jgi:metallo-beta-lactamase class B